MKFPLNSWIRIHYEKLHVVQNVQNKPPPPQKKAAGLFYVNRAEKDFLNN